MKIAQQYEATSKQLDDIHGRQSVVHALHTNQRNKPKNRRPDQRKTHTPPPSAPSSACNNCGRTHSRAERCPAHGTTCKACGKSNHWAKMCRSSQRSHGARKAHSTRVHALHEADVAASQEDADAIYFHTLQHTAKKTSDVTRGNDSDTQAFVTLNTALGSQASDIKFKIDTGSEGNVIPLSVYRSLLPENAKDVNGMPPGLRPSTTRLIAFGGHSIQNFGTCNLTVSHHEKRERCVFHVSQASGPAILGLPTCRALNLVSLHFNINVTDSAPTDEREDIPNNMEAPQPSKPRGDDAARQTILREYGDVFQGIGCFDGKFHIDIDPKVKPVVHPPRRVPFALRDPLKKELDSLADRGIIEPVSQPTDWVNSCVCVTKKNGDIRLCLDPKDLNQAIKRPHYPTPTFDDVVSRLHGAKWFSILDARSGYWNIQLDDESKLLTTFNTPFGRYCYRRLPMGLRNAQDVYQGQMDKMFGDIPGVFGIADDLVIAGWDTDGRDHDETLKLVLERARQKHARFNDEKMVVRCKSIPFFGHVIGENGISPDPAKIAAVQQMSRPTDVKSLLSFLGMVNYLNRFTPCLSELTAPLRDLCKEDSEFIWGPEHDSAFSRIKTEICATNNLPFYNPGKPLTLQVDASSRGLGAALIQEERPIAFASKALTDTETRYSNIEREFLAVVYGLERFHEFVFGREIRIETDHRPLVSIVKKNLANVSPRLARMLLRTQPYNYTLEYVTGKCVPLADALSRVDPVRGAVVTGLDITVHEMNLSATPARFDQFREATACDPELVALRDVIIKGWPDTRADCPAQLHPYWTFRDEMGVADGVVIKGDRIVVPVNLRGMVLDKIHLAHQGIEKCKLRAKSAVYWVGMYADIEEMVRKCGTCQKYQSSLPKEPLHQHDIPPGPWHTLSTDLFHWEQSPYLLVVDQYSKFPIIRKLNSLSAASVINHMRGIFDEHGICNVLMSDGGPQYSCREFKEFAADYGFRHIMSSPHYPSSNGFIERQVRTVKTLFTKARETGTDPHMAMICLRTTPLDHKLPSPCELLNSRLYRSNLPGKMPRDIDRHSDALQRRQDNVNKWWGPGRPQPALRPQQHVRVQHPVNKTWVPGQVIACANEPRAYHVQTQSGVYRRNRRHVRPTIETPQHQNTQDDASADIDTPQTAAVSTAAEPSIPLRRSQRIVKKPERLNL